MNQVKLRLGLSQELIPLVLDGSMTETYRLGLKYDFIEVGDLVEIENSQTKELIGNATIIFKKIVGLLDVPTKFGETREDVRKRLESYYKTKISDTDGFLMFGFKLNAK